MCRQCFREKAHDVGFQKVCYVKLRYVMFGPSGWGLALGNGAGLTDAMMAFRIGDGGLSCWLGEVMHGRGDV